jgi:hypothetical protein
VCAGKPVIGFSYLYFNPFPFEGIVLPFMSGRVWSCKVVLLSFKPQTPGLLPTWYATLFCRFLRYDDPDSPILSERRSARAVQRKTIDASQYIDPEEMDFEGQEWLMPEHTEPKPEKVRGLDKGFRG